MFFSVTGYMNLYLYILRWCLIIQVFSFVSQKENECPTIQTQIRMLRIVVMNILWAVKGHVSMLCDVLRLERSLSGPQEMCWSQYHLLLRYLRAEREKHDSEQWRKTKRLPRSYQTSYHEFNINPSCEENTFCWRKKMRSSKLNVLTTWRFISVYNKDTFCTVWRFCNILDSFIYIYFCPWEMIISFCQQDAGETILNGKIPIKVVLCFRACFTITRA